MSGSNTGTINRRAIIKATVAGGLGGVGTTRVSGATLGSGAGEKKITVLAQGNEAHKTVYVPKRWYRNVQRAKRVRDVLMKRLEDRDDLLSIGIESGHRTVGDLRTKRVHVDLSPDGTETAIPSSINGIPISVYRRDPSTPTDYYNTELDDKLYGGIAAFGVVSGTTAEEVTLCCRVYNNGTKYMLGCRHMFVEKNCKDSDGDDGDIVGDTWGRDPENSDENAVGFVEKEYQRYDATLINNSSDTRPFKYDIADETGGVIGRVTGNGLDYLNSNNTTVRKRGRKTGATQGYITSTGGRRYCPNLNGYQDGMLEATNTQKPGDSGGPLYYWESDSGAPDDIYLVGMPTREKNGSAYGSSANIMNNQRGITFGGNPYDGG